MENYLKSKIFRENQKKLTLLMFSFRAKLPHFAHFIAQTNSRADSTTDLINDG